MMIGIVAAVLCVNAFVSESIAQLSLLLKFANSAESQYLTLCMRFAAIDLA
ncbi:MAG: hypothetical protein OFPII_11210 [Osedax symbiont Rs1]|nr:MAG: hypothetical protein OFPII_11210 [Osedax symbiont Rs1]